ncbi:MAG: hypothetical protein QNK45_05505 [Flavobacteriaceae bacterium]
MKTINKFFTLLFVFTAFVSCKEDFLEETDFGIVAPSNVNATFNITQDNTGLVTITPTAVGAVKFDVDFGDGSEVATAIAVGKHAKHTYTEGNHTVGVTANGLGGLKATATVDLVVSFKAPQNLVVAITNSETISKQVDVVATADFATTFDVNVGVDGVEAVSANIGDTATYIYDEAGTYTITVTAKGGAIETTSSFQDFEVTAIQQPVISADTPPSRKITDVVSVFSSVYDDLTGTDFFPDWGQSTIYTEYDLEGDKMIQYANLNYQGVQFETQNVSNMQYLHMDVWTADLASLEIYPISAATGEKFVTKALTADSWTTIDIPLSAFTDQGLSMADIFQFKFVDPDNSGKTIFIDNLYFYKNPSEPSPLAGKWKVKSEAGSLKVGPSPGNGEWWSIDAAGVTARAVFFDDEYIFNSDGSFQNVMQDQTWVEGWQSGADEGAGAPVAPHDGSASATYLHNQTTNTVTINGKGAYIGLPKAVNAGELPNVAVPNSVAYNVALSEDNNSATVTIEAGGGVWWTFEIQRETVSPTQLFGVWKLSSEPGSLGVGPSPGSTEWWNLDAAGVTARSMFVDDSYSFMKDGSFVNILGGETWLEGWQNGGADEGPGAPVAPYDGSKINAFNFDPIAGTITVIGEGAYLGLPKAVNAGELPNVAVPGQVTYNVSFTDADSISVSIEAGSGVWWNYKLVRATQKISGTWTMALEAGSLGVGPSAGSVEWWSIDDAGLTQRAVYFDDQYVIGSAGSFKNILGSETWVEGWQNGGDAEGVGAPVAPHDGSTNSIYVYDDVLGKITVYGKGSYIGLPKAVNAGELPNVEVPENVTYNVTFVDDNTIKVNVEAGAGVWWNYKLVK